MLALKFDPAAEIELSEAALYYDEQISGLGISFADKVKEAINRIQNHPIVFPIVEDLIRR